RADSVAAVDGAAATVAGTGGSHGRGRRRRGRSRFRPRLRVFLLAAAALLALATASPAAASPVTPAEPLPVPSTFFAGIGPELVDPGGSLPGVNDWGCVPSAEHPNPVILLHGTGGGAQTNWGAMAPRIKNAGYCVYALTYGQIPGAPWPVSAIGGMAPMQDSAQQLSDFVD